MNMIKYCMRTIEYSFYALFFLVPLVFSADTSELFELNKMWVTFGLTTIIGVTWLTKMILEKRVIIQRTPLDIVLILFVFSQIISSIFSLDQHVSWWGYYSRFNGGLLSTFCYVILYYAFVTNLDLKQVIKTLGVSLITGFAVALWGFPSHFGADPTCFLFRGTLDTSCWTDAFKPTIRTFSTLGQPAWLAAYMAFLTPLTIAIALLNTHKKFWVYASLAVFFYISLLFTDTRAGFIGFWIANGLLWTIITLKKITIKKNLLTMFLLFNLSFGFCSFIFGSPIGPLSKFTLPQLAHPNSQKPAESLSGTAQPTTGGGITTSGDIRLNVWKGAMTAWEQNPLFGTGVETYAFAYYKYKPAAHNMTSEWDYLYNKAHNEYLNYLATTGVFGLGTYIAFLGLFGFITAKWFFINKATNEKEQLLVVGLLTGWISILITNFFGFSVVIMNLYLFLVPIFVLILSEKIKRDEKPQKQDDLDEIGPYQWTGITVIAIGGIWIILALLWYRQADIAYALGNNLDKTGQYQQAYEQLTQAAQAEPNEPVYQDELAINLGVIGAALYTQKDASRGAEFAKNAIQLNDSLLTAHPNSVIYWKNRVRIFYALSSSDPTHAKDYLTKALEAIDAAKALAPNDAKIAYNQGVLSGQAGQTDKAIAILQDTIRLKSDYTDAYVALGLFYHEKAADKNGTITNHALQQKAIETYEYILKNLSPNDKEVQKSLQAWQTNP
jgi:tetratricopeptide (TPR) repeat protein